MRRRDGKNGIIRLLFFYTGSMGTLGRGNSRAVLLWRSQKRVCKVCKGVWSKEKVHAQSIWAA